MPLYEYRCKDCRHRVAVFQSYSDYGKIQPACPDCGGRNLERLISRVRVARSEESRLESLADPSSLSGLDENDPGSVARWMKKMGKELGEDFGGEDIDQIAEEAAQEATGGGDTGGEGGTSSGEL